MTVAGIGALPYEGGTAFRVWAPHASEVSVIGEFNGWEGTAHELSQEDGGYWYGEVPGARVGQQYRFALATASGVVTRIDPRARAVTNSVGNGIIYARDAFDWQGDAFACPPHDDLVIYELHVGSFDGGRPTFEGLVERLGHFAHLGVNALELMPVMEFAGERSWGYNPAHPFAVEGSYGGPDGLKYLVREAHRQGIAVLVDVVYNHFGPSDLGLWQFDGWSENGMGGIYFYNDDRATTPWGDTRPDYGRQEVREYIRDNALMWLEEYHVDGLRYDMTPFIRDIDGDGDDLPDGWSLLRAINGTIRETHPDVITIAEDLKGDYRLTNLDDDGARFHAQWDSLFVHPVRQATVQPSDDQRSVTEIAVAVGHSYGAAFRRVVYTESHDEVANGKQRVPSEIDEGDPDGWFAQKRSTAAACFVFTAPGIPMVFQGQEFLEKGWFRDDVPLDWWRNEEFQGIVRLYRDLIRLRRNADGDTAGLRGEGLSVHHLDEEGNLLAYHRWAEGGPGDDVVVIANMSAQERTGVPIGMPAAGGWRLKFNSDATTYSDVFHGFPAHDVEAAPEPLDGQDAHALIDIGPYTVLVYVRA